MKNCHLNSVANVVLRIKQHWRIGVKITWSSENARPNDRPWSKWIIDAVEFASAPNALYWKSAISLLLKNCEHIFEIIYKSDS